MTKNRLISKRFQDNERMLANLKKSVIICASVFLALAPVLSPYRLIYLGEGVTVKIVEFFAMILGTLAIIIALIEKRKPGFFALLSIIVFFTALSALSFMYPAEGRNFGYFIKSSLVYLATALSVTYLWLYLDRKLFSQVVIGIAMITTFILFAQIAALNMGVESVFDGKIPFLEMSEYATWSNLRDPTSGMVRAHSVFQEPSFYSIYVLPAFIWSLQNKRYYCAVLFVVGIVVSSSLLGILASALIIVFFFIRFLSACGNKRAIHISLITFACVLIAFLTIYFFSSSFKSLIDYYISRTLNIFDDIQSERMGSTRFRLIGYLPRFKEYPIFFKILGVGTNQFSSYLSVIQYSSVVVGTVLNHGVIGLLSLIYLLLKVYKSSAKENRSYMIPFVLVCFLDSQWMTWYFFYLITWLISKNRRSQYTNDCSVINIICENQSDDDLAHFERNSLEYPILSIIIPAYNVQDYVGRTLSSILKQNDSRIEVIIVNDGSTDNTLDTINKIGNKYNCKNLLILSQSNLGVSAARNCGLSKAQGKYVLFLDGDDVVHSAFVKVALEELSAAKLDVLYWPYNYESNDGEIISNYPYHNSPTNLSGADMLEHLIVKHSAWICTGSAAYNRDLLKRNRVQYPEGCVSGEDVEFIFRALSVSKCVMFSRKLLTGYVQRPESTTKKFSIRIFDSVLAYFRVSDHFKTSTNDKIVKLAPILKEVSSVNNFITNYMICFNHFAKSGAWKLNAIKKKLDRDIDYTYPGLRSDIEGLMKKSKGWRQILKNLLFSSSSVLYYRIWRIFR